jgi:hypothetical protein
MLQKYDILLFPYRYFFLSNIFLFLYKKLLLKQRKMKQLFMKKTLLLFFLAITLFSCNKEKYTLEYNLQAGESYVQNANIVMTITQQMMGESLTMATDMKMNLHFDVLSVENDTITSEISYDEIGMNMDLGFMQMSFDSNTDDSIATESDLSPMLKAMINQPMTAVMDKRGKILSVGGYDKISNAMINSISEDIGESAKNEMLAQFERQLGEEALKKSFEQISFYFPEKKVAVGDTWKTVSNVEGEMPMSIDMTMTLKSVDNNEALIDVKGTIAGNANIQELNNENAAVNTTGTQSGWVKLDMLSGWLIESEMTQNMQVKTAIRETEFVQEVVNVIKIAGK